MIAFAEITRKPVCVVSIDFNAAFDKIWHEYLQEILSAHGFSASFNQRIMRLYNNATSEIQINDFRSSLIPIKSSIRQGCPLSMLLYAMCLNPLMPSLEKNLSGIKIARRQVRTTVVAHADDVTIFLSCVADIQQPKETLLAFEAATGAVVTYTKNLSTGSRHLGYYETDYGHPVP